MTNTYDNEITLDKDNNSNIDNDSNNNDNNNNNNNATEKEPEMGAYEYLLGRLKPGDTVKRLYGATR